MRFATALAVTCAALACATTARAGEDEPKTWEQLFFPFPIVGAPPQLEQQVQLFDSYFRGTSGSGDVVSAEIGWILSPQIGIVATVPFQFGLDGQTTGFQDSQFLLQVLAAGSLRDDWMLSVGLETTLPTGHDDLSAGSAYAGMFAYFAKRFFHHLIFEANATTLFPMSGPDVPGQIIGAGLISLLLTPRKFAVPVYAQVEADTTLEYAGAEGTNGSVFVAPEIFLGPFKTPISEGTRLAAGASFNVVGDDVHGQTYTLTVAFDIPNKYGY